MKFAYKFNNILGTVYRHGNLVFTPDGNSLISPVGNKITIYNLKNNKSCTLPIESRYNYTTLDLAPNGCILIAINEEGEAHMISLISKTIVHRYRFKRPIHSVKFSPDGKYFAVCKESNVFIFKAPGQFSGEYNAFVMERVFHGSYDDTTCLDWSFDSKILAVGSKDMSTRLYSLEKFQNFKTYSLSSHTDTIVSCFFEKDTYDITTISRNGQACVWECTIEPEQLVAGDFQPIKKKSRNNENDSSEDDVEVNVNENIEDLEKEMVKNSSLNDENKNQDETSSNLLHYKRLARHYLLDPVKKQDKNAILTSAAYHKESRILIVGFSTGSFFLYELPEMNMIHSLSISEQIITAISVNQTGDWIALGCSGLGQLLVWEWQSETYVMKQQGHANNMSCVAYSADGQYIATGGADGKLKLWNVLSGFCFITFEEHTAPITGVTFSYNKKFVISSSLDGTVRAYDITRYRNFRTFTTPRPVQLSCVSVDYSGELVAAGGQDVFEIFLWSIKLGRLLEILSGHEGPVCSIAFNPSPTSTALASVSWDKTLRLWNALENGSQHETLELTSDALCVVYKPDGEEIAVATLDSNISIFHVRTATQTHTIEGRNDLGSGRSESDLVTSKQNLKAKAFTSLCYSADGDYILAGGQSKNVCIYHVQETLIVKKIEITQNRSLDAMDDFINRRKMTDFGNIDLVEERDENEGGKVALKLPGTKKLDPGQRTTKPEVRVFSLQFSPSGDSWAAATTEGLLIYSLNKDMVFDPWELDVSITPISIRAASSKLEHSNALMMAIKLNESNIIQEIIEKIPPNDIELTIQSLPDVYIEKILNIVGNSLENSRHIEFYLKWAVALLLQAKSTKVSPATLLMVQRALQRRYDQISKICDFNKYTLQVLSQLSHNIKKKNALKSNEEDDLKSENNSSDEEMMDFSE